ncbi:flagellar hook-length control protein FliK [Cereibacter sp. SYSU M97828]|nr:flagellar hook-length control protein FliK [Cereibacter flavus]
MLIGARLIPLLFPMLSPSAEGGEIIAFDIGLGEGGDGTAPPPELFAPDEPTEPEEAGDDDAVDPAAAPPCWWPADPVPEPPAIAPCQTGPEQIGVADETSPPTERDLETSALTESVGPSRTEIAPPEADGGPADAPQPDNQATDPQTRAQTEPLPDAPSESQGEQHPDARREAPERADPPILPDRPDPAAAEPAQHDRPPPETARAEQQRGPERPPAVEEAARRAAPAEAPAALEPAPQADGLGDIQVMFEREGDATRITLVAERAETVDLMRRHADQLQNELAREGLADADLSFAERQQNRQTTSEETSGEAPLAIALPPSVPASGLDLRL